MEAIPPYDQWAEEATISALLIDGDAIGVLDLVPSDFFMDHHQVIYQAILNVKDCINEVTVSHELNRMGKYDEVGGAAYLLHLISQMPSSVGIEGYAEIVKKCAFSRRIISAAGQLESVGYKNDTTEESVAKINEVNRKLLGSIRDNSVLNPEDVVKDAFDYYMNTEKQKALPTGIPSFDRIKGGYLPGEYVMLAARSGKGKTTMALQEACYIAQDKKVAFFSMEMLKQQVTNKNVARITGISEQAIALKGHYTEYNEQTGELKHHKGFTETQWKQIVDALGQLSKLNLYIYEGNRDLAGIKLLVEKHLLTTGLDMVFIDYLGLIKDRVGRDGHDRINYISEELSRMPKEYQIPFKVLHQFNRDIEYRKDEDAKPMMRDLREGGEESVDLLEMLVHCPDNAFQSEIYIHKDRLRGDPCVIKVNWNQGRYS